MVTVKSQHHYNGVTVIKGLEEALPNGLLEARASLGEASKKLSKMIMSLGML
jgi:hypothetical protein